MALYGRPQQWGPGAAIILSCGGGPSVERLRPCVNSASKLTTNSTGKNKKAHTHTHQKSLQRNDRGLRTESEQPLCPSMASYSVEYAKSNRATCKGCKVKIDKDTLRVGTTVPGPGDYDMTSWRHLACQKKPAALTSPTALVGFASLKSADQDLVRQWYGGNTAAVAADKRKSDAASAMASPVFSTPKKQKMSPSSGAAAMAAGASSPLPKSSASTAASVPTDAEEEIKAMDAARTTFACLTLPDLKSCLRANEQLVGGTKPELIRAARTGKCMATSRDAQRAASDGSRWSTRARTATAGRAPSRAPVGTTTISTCGAPSAANRSRVPHGR